MHFGVFCDPTSSHVQCFGALGARLKMRGHRITFFQVPDVESGVLRAGLEFCPVGAARYPPGTLREWAETASRQNGLSALRCNIRRGVKISQMFLEEAPAAIKGAGVDALLIDLVEIYGSTVAEHMAIPFVRVALALPSFRDDCVPPYFTHWKYRPNLAGRVRNRLGYAAFSWLVRPLLAAIDQQRRTWGLSDFMNRQTKPARLADVCQIPECFDFPRIALPRFHYTGPFSLSAVRPDTAFPWERLDGRPIVYVSMGAIMADSSVFHAIALACNGLDVQVVISLSGGIISDGELDHLPGNPIVVRYAPQLELIKRAALVISHAGLNTVLESLAHGVPTVTIPLNFDQPGVAARVAWLGAGEVVPLRRVRAKDLRSAVHRVILQSNYKEAAQRLRTRINAVDGPSRASDVIERSFGVPSWAARQQALSPGYDEHQLSS